jgi:hypothetical protein
MVAMGWGDALKEKKIDCILLTFDPDRLSKLKKKTKTIDGK